MLEAERPENEGRRKGVEKHSQVIMDLTNASHNDSILQSNVFSEHPELVCNLVGQLPES